MNKSLIYSYICELDKELLGVVAYSQFSGIIVSEIVNRALINLHERPEGLESDEKIAKSLISQNIRSFFTPINVAKIIDKFQNWDNRVCYGHRGKRSFSTKDLIEFKLAMDTRSGVNKLEVMMLEAVKNFSFKGKPTGKPTIRLPFVTIIISIIVITLASIGIYTYSINNRYQRINASIVFDNWNGRSIDVYEDIENR